jgi:putative transcriptional regulator
MSKTFKSDALAAIHETASDLSDVGLMDKQTMREFDKLCLTPVVALTPDEIKEIRLNTHVSQSVFAHYLNVSPGVVSQWERGEKRPAGASLKLLLIVRNKGLEAIA